VKEEREADTERMAADEKRRRAADRRRSSTASRSHRRFSRLGRTQRDLLQTMLRRPVAASSTRSGWRCAGSCSRGLAERIDGEGGSHRLTDTARSLVAARL
jgi:hypothetical protein